jgi:putative transposase
MERTLDLCRWVYNQTLALRKNAWENESKSISKYETNSILPTWKKDKPELKEVFSQVLQNVQARVDLALKAFFRRIKAGEKPGYPRFRDNGRYGSVHLSSVWFLAETRKAPSIQNRRYQDQDVSTYRGIDQDLYDKTYAYR